jgi:hypothetical protein
MTAARYDLTIEQGADFALELTVKEDGAAKPLTDITEGVDPDQEYVVRAQLRQTQEQTTADADFSATITDKAAGKIQLSLPFNISRDLTAGVYFYDLELVKQTIPPTGVAVSEVGVTRLLTGKANIRREVTR